MILDHVAQAADGLIECPPSIHAKLLSHRDLHTGDRVTVPDRLQEGVGETKVEQVLDRVLAEKVVDAEDRGLRKDGLSGAVEPPRRREIAPEGLLDDDPRVVGQAGSAELLDDRGEEKRWDGQVVRGTGGFAKGLLQRRERVGILVVPVHVPKPGQQVTERAPVVDATSTVGDAVLCEVAQLLEIPARMGHTDDGNIEHPSFGHRVQRGENLLARQIPGCAEEDQRIAAALRGRSSPHVTRSPRPVPKA